MKNNLVNMFFKEIEGGLEIDNSHLRKVHAGTSVPASRNLSMKALEFLKPNLSPKSLFNNPEE